MQSDIIFDYDFKPKEFATFEGTHNRFRVRIIDVLFIDKQKFYMIKGPRELMLQEDYTDNYKGVIYPNQMEYDENWITNIAEPDELSLPEQFLRRIK